MRLHGFLLTYGVATLHFAYQVSPVVVEYYALNLDWLHAVCRVIT